MSRIFSFFRVTALWVLLLPSAFTFLGAASNQLVLIANGDKFPVMLNDSKIAKAEIGSDGMLDEVHCVMTTHTHLNFLADIFDFHQYIESIGDMFVELGAWLWTFCPFIWGGIVIRKIHV